MCNANVKFRIITDDFKISLHFQYQIGWAFVFNFESEIQCYWAHVITRGYFEETCKNVSNELLPKNVIGLWPFSTT